MPPCEQLRSCSVQAEICRQVAAPSSSWCGAVFLVPASVVRDLIGLLGGLAQTVAYSCWHESRSRFLRFQDGVKQSPCSQLLKYKVGKLHHSFSPHLSFKMPSSSLTHHDLVIRACDLKGLLPGLRLGSPFSRPSVAWGFSAEGFQISKPSTFPVQPSLQLNGAEYRAIRSGTLPSMSAHLLKI